MYFFTQLHARPVLDTSFTVRSRCFAWRRRPAHLDQGRLRGRRLAELNSGAFRSGTIGLDGECQDVHAVADPDRLSVGGAVYTFLRSADVCSRFS